MKSPTMSYTRLALWMLPILALVMAGCRHEETVDTPPAPNTNAHMPHLQARGAQQQAVQYRRTPLSPNQ